MPLGAAPAISTPSAPTPLGAAPVKSAAERTDAAAAAALAAAARNEARVALHARRSAFVRATLIVVALIGAGCAAWWLAPEPARLVEGPTRTAFDDRPMPGAEPAPSAATVATPASTTAPVVAGTPASAPPLPNTDGLDAVAAELMRVHLPRAADAAERQLARVLKLAGEASDFRRRGAIRAAAQAARATAAPPAFATPRRADDARALNDAALVAYGTRDDVKDAVGLQTQAFGANPLDAEVAGNLAFLRLKERPPQAEGARQLALHALTLKDARYPGGRVEDWTTFAIASALVGHDVDARNAWYVALALTTDVQRQCDAALRAQASYGARFAPSVQAMLLRARSSAAYGRCDGADRPAPASPARVGARTGKNSHRQGTAARPTG